MACLHDEGWVGAEVVGDGDGIVFDELTADQREPFSRSMTDCREAAGPSPRDVPLAEERVRAHYHHLVASVACLEEAGHPISTPPPSESTLVDQYLHGDPENGTWSPFLEVDLTRMSQEEWDALNARCPQSLR